MRKQKNLGKGSIIPKVAFIRKVVLHKAGFPVHEVLLYGVERPISRYLIMLLASNNLCNLAR